MANNVCPENALCMRCIWAKDKVANRYVNGCYCVQYGYIVAHPKTECRGFVDEQVREQENNR